MNNKYISGLVLAVLICVTGVAQKVNFVYLQTEPQQPFFVKMNDKTYSSSASGYLILPKMVDGEYPVTVGFTNKKYPDQQFTLKIASRDYGYLLKNFADKGWGFYDMQSQEIVYAKKSAGENAVAKNTSSEGPVPATKPADKPVDGFTNVLSKVANDPTLGEKKVVEKPVEKKAEVIVKEVETPAVVQPVKEKQQIVAVPAEIKPVSNEKKEVIGNVTATGSLKELEKEFKETFGDAQVRTVQQVKQDNLGQSKVERRGESSTTQGFSVVYIDHLPSGDKDTIRVQIPNAAVTNVVPVDVKEEAPKAVELVKEQVGETKIVQNKPTVANKEKEGILFIDIDGDADITTNASSMAKKTVEGGIKPKGNKSCADPATEDDFIKLRRSMVGAEDEDEMIFVAKKAFKLKCYTTDQVKNITVLLLTEKGKYELLDAAYVTTFDPDNYHTLQSLLKDDYYIQRFKALLR